MKLWVVEDAFEDELYGLHTYAGYGGIEVDLPKEVFNRYQKACNKFIAVQALLEDAYQRARAESYERARERAKENKARERLRPRAASLPQS